MHTANMDRNADKAIDGVVIGGGIQRIYNYMNFLGKIAHVYAVGTRLSFPPPHLIRASVRG